MKIVRKLFLGLLILIGLGAVGFILWGATPAAPMDEFVESMRPSSTVAVEAGKWLVFIPQEDEVTTGFIFYPGGRVDYRAYAYYARALAENGVLVVIPRMPLNLAVFGVNKAGGIMAAYPDISHWVIGGHSLGGSMAANYVYSHPDQIDGLVLLASYPAESNDLSEYSGAVTSISASLDGLATTEKIGASHALLPDTTNWVVIEGGNHAQFGWYGVQKGDHSAEITREEQQAIVIRSILDLLEQVDQ